MTIDDLVEELTHTTRQRFIAKNTIYNQLRERVHNIGEYAMTATALQGLDALALTLKREQRDDIADITATIDAARSPYREQGEQRLFEVMRTNNAHYTTRFDRIHELLDAQASFAYDDLALTQDWLRTNQYVKRKRTTHEGFDKAAKELEQALEQRMEKQRIFHAPIQDPNTYHTQSFPDPQAPNTTPPTYTLPEMGLTGGQYTLSLGQQEQPLGVTQGHELTPDHAQRLAQSMAPPTFTRTQKVLGAAAIGVSSALMVLSWLPQHLYAPFYQ